MSVIEILEQAAKMENPKEGDLVIGEQEVLETAANFYVGRLCAEYTDGVWLPLPYSRDSPYFADKKEVISVLAKMKENASQESAVA